MENIEGATGILEQLRALGVELSIDDFGTGYSSLSYLHRLPIDTLKIDRSFISCMGENNENKEIVRTIILLAQNLKMGVVAEGIETEEQLAQLRELNCQDGQGYLFSKPVDAAAAGSFISKLSQMQTVNASTIDLPNEDVFPPVASAYSM
jgi:EAL domain-containing protein (putative c-di-GMP-specific phosphodiesterase class I)